MWLANKIQLRSAKLKVQLVSLCGQLREILFWFFVKITAKIQPLNQKVAVCRPSNISHVTTNHVGTRIRVGHEFASIIGAGGQSRGGGGGGRVGRGY